MSRIRMSNHEELHKTVDSAFEEAYELIMSEEGWREVKRNECGDVVVTKMSKRGKQIYRVRGVINIAPEKLIPALQDVNNTTTWNNTLTKCEIVSELSENVKISYQITGSNGLVSSRDFIMIFKQ